MDIRSARILSEIKTMDPDLFALQVIFNEIVAITPSSNIRSHWISSITIDLYG